MIEDRWWDATRDRRLAVQRCACGHAQHYPRELCTRCGGTDLMFDDASGHGTVDSFTVVHRAPSSDVEAPYVVARVRLADGPIILTHLAGPGPWACDEPVRLGWRPLPDGRHLPVFTKDA
ncbi:Zn-ribbon domain-containing OB-fold protein [Actinomadura opuntiae]|uniref:Zn-ribbon domain-containing OB-fold protein n=1 Tax=Actinomadura sp. OS1-43 TaxID=604315 RepID=UPI00255B06A1|nr:OB-fold domain-containing protein [Actinomadura sp. OS1-43]MDL4813227.1 OB-fold domain-containing protein [Actinomadura sp. OS1-43]